jgi:hypothetical protein
MTRPATAFRSSGLRLTVCLAVLALAGAGALSAIASASEAVYTVNIGVVPDTVPVSSHYTVVVTGGASSTSTLVVYVNVTQKCKKTPQQESRVSNDLLSIRTPVVGVYNKTYRGTATYIGLHHACAYLLLDVLKNASYLQEARAGEPFHVTAAAAG